MADFSQKQVRNRYFSEYGSGGLRGSREIEERFFERLRRHIFDFLLDRLNIVFNANPVEYIFELICIMRAVRIATLEAGECGFTPA